MSEEVTKTERGFNTGTSIPSEYGGYIRAYESSAVDDPHLWVRIESPENIAFAHLTLENAIRLRDQLTYLIDNHYQT